jgi:hypothetical protein
MIVYSVHGWRHFLVCTYVLHFVCFGEETWNCMHFLVILSENFVSWWRTALHRFYVYRKPISSPRSRNLKVIKKCVHLKCICVWCLNNWSRILSGKLFDTFSMARLKTLQFHLTLTPLSSDPHSPFHCHACISYLSFIIFFHDDGRGISDYDWGILFILVTLDLRLLLIHRDLWNSHKWQTLISVNRDLDFFLFSEIRDQNPLPLLKFYGKGVQIDLNLQTFFSSIFICIF